MIPSFFTFIFHPFAVSRRAICSGLSGLRAGLVRPVSGLRALFAALALVFAAATGSATVNAEELPVLPLTVNVNTADARTIANVLQGVGLSRAAAIVAYREEHGAFKSIDALTSVKGVGTRTLELNATRIVLAE